MPELFADVTSDQPSGRADDSDSEQQLAAALQEVCEAMESGETVDRSVLLQKYPDVRDELISCLDNLDFINQVAPQLGDGGHASTASGGIRPLATLGDFRIVRELGRGGMGVVYEAEQLSLGRTVALKVLPFAAMLDKKQLERFKNEARAAATLNHSNIVPVYSVGTERGVHYYAMQLIEGQSLAEVIVELRDESGESSDKGHVVSRDVPATSNQLSPSSSASSQRPIANSQQLFKTTVAAALFTVRTNQPREYYRKVAQLGIQAADALAHAHECGVLHRDIKPANLLVDDTGKLWITDFGLARLETDSRMTATGDLVGTLRYMSPEQALGEHKVIDERADIYSLGITLYELLALQPAIAGRRRDELLRSISFDDPCALRKFDHSVPRELELIVNKAINKNRDDRYTSMQGFEDDLQRFLDHRPIQAKPPAYSPLSSIIPLSTWQPAKRMDLCIAGILKRAIARTA